MCCSCGLGVSKGMLPAKYFYFNKSSVVSLTFHGDNKTSGKLLKVRPP